jgi:putative transposase
MLENVKGLKVKATMRRNKERRKELGVAVYQLKVDESHLSKSVRRSLEKMFLEAKWLYNSVLNNKAFEYDASLKNVGVYVFNKETEKCDILEERPLTLGSQIKQSIVKRACQNIINLSKTKKSGKSIGKLKFKKEVNCVPLKQFGNTFRICGKNYLRIQGVGKIRVSGLLQLAGKDIACANLTKKASGFFVRVTCYEEKKETPRSGEIGIDMGIKDTLVFSDGRKVNVRVKIPRRLKRLQKNLSRKKRGSRRYVKNKIAFKKVCEKLSRRKDDIANNL